MIEKKKAQCMTDEQLGVAANTLRDLSELYWRFNGGTSGRQQKGGWVSLSVEPKGPN